MLSLSKIINLQLNNYKKVEKVMNFYEQVLFSGHDGIHFHSDVNFEKYSWPADTFREVEIFSCVPTVY